MHCEMDENNQSEAGFGRNYKKTNVQSYKQSTIEIHA